MAIRHDVVSHPFTVQLIKIKAAQLCRRTDIARSDGEDMQQEMLLYLWKKACLYDAARGNIEAFVTTAINSWVGMELRRRDRQKRRDGFRALSLERTMIERGGDTTSLGGVLSDADHRRRSGVDPRDALEEIDLQDAIAHTLGQFTPSERAVLASVADHGVAAAARKHNVSRRQINNALAQMRPRFEDAGLGEK